VCARYFEKLDEELQQLDADQAVYDLRAAPRALA